MTEILTCETARNRFDLSGGGKGRSLHALASAGFTVPRWSIIPAEAHTHFVSATGLVADLNRLLEREDGDDFAGPADKILHLFESEALDPNSLELIRAAYMHVGTAAVAVRSSALDEDGLEHSFAGQYDSFLNVTSLADVCIAVRRCWASSYSARALSYRKVRGLPLRPQPMAVIIQTMVAAEVSGVAFTANPITGATDEIVISAVPGLGEGLVSGKVDADTITLDKATYVTKEFVIGEKAEKVVASRHAPGVQTINTGEEAASPCLSDDQAAAIADIAVMAEKLHGCPQDIEWSICGGVVYLLQARPITTGGLGRSNGFGAHVWENSNIIENFSGLTSPLTFSFARDVYHQIYLEYARILGTPRTQLVEMNEWLHHMLGYHNGRVYYDLLNWYKIVRLVPFYAVNRRMLDLAIGVETPLHERSALQLVPMPSLTGWRNGLVRLKSAVLFAWYFLFIAAYVRRFVADFHERHQAVERMPLREMSAELIHVAFRRVRIEFLSQWGRMILLEQTIGLSIGVLNVLVKRWLPDAGQRIFFDLMRPTEVLDSVLPATRMTVLANQLQATPTLMQAIMEGKEDGLYQRLKSNDSPAVQDFLTQVDTYIEEFGYRSLNELKLEEPDLREKPDSFFAMLRAHLTKPDLLRSDKKSGDDVASALAALALWKRGVIRLVSRKVKTCLAARERVRFCRTRAFGSVRRMINAMGQNFFERKMLARADDIFMLRIDELRDWACSTLSHDDLVCLVEHRKAQLGGFRALESPSRFISSGFNVSGSYSEKTGWCSAESMEADIAEPGARMKGTPCGGGRVIGEAAVVSEPLHAAGKILVTYRTDPGWCAVLPSASALLIERGSPLTHVAIVARELGVPTIIQIKDLTRRVRNGAELEVDGVNGTILVRSNPGLASENPESVAVK